MLKKRNIIIITVSIIIIAILIITKIFIFKKDESYAMKVNSHIISPEIYNAYIVQKTLLAKSKVTDNGEDLMKQKIDGILVPEWIQAKTREQIIYDCVIKDETDKEKISMNQSDKTRLDNYLEQQWEGNQDSFVSNECKKEVVDATYQGFVYAELLFEKYAKDNPVKEKVPESQLATAKYFLMNKFGLDGNKFTKEQTEKLGELAKKYTKQINNKKSIDEIYKSYLIQTGEELGDYRPLTTSVIASDNTEYTSKIPKFVEALMKAKVEEAIYAEDNYYITIGIRLKDEDNKSIKQAYTESDTKNAIQEKFNKNIEAIIKKASVKINEHVIEKYSPKLVTLSERKVTETQ